MILVKRKPEKGNLFIIFFYCQNRKDTTNIHHNKLRDTHQLWVSWNRWNRDSGILVFWNPGVLESLMHALLPGSPAIDAGSIVAFPVPEFDQRGPGFSRVVGAGLDIGAVEADFRCALRPRRSLQLIR